MEPMETSYSPAMGKLFEALSKAQGKIEAALKDKKNPFFKSSYADLSNVWDACRQHLSENGLAIVQTVEGTKENMFLTTWLGHASGEWIKSRLPLLLVKPDPQGVGSAITYARRYALSAMVGVCSEEDDDGEKAMIRERKLIPQKPVEDPDEVERRVFQFLSQWPKEEWEDVKIYLQKYATHWKKGMIESIENYKDISKFQIDFKIWKKKEQERKAS